MHSNISNLPLNISFDTHILSNFVLPSAFDELDILRLESIMNETSDNAEYKSAYYSQKVLLENYCCIKFLKHMLENNKIKLHITPTAHSELIHSKVLEDKFLEFIEYNNYDISGLIPDHEIVSIVHEYAKQSKINSLNSITQLISSAKDFSTFETPLASLSTPNKHLVKMIQNSILTRIKEHQFCYNLECFNDNVDFIYFPYEDSILENDLRKDIFCLSESYRIDRKRIQQDSNGRQIIKNKILCLKNLQTA